MIETQVTNIKDLETRLLKIITLGFKFSPCFGIDTELEQVYRLLGDIALTDDYKFKYGIENTTAKIN